MKEFWDERYVGKEYFYGTRPNHFLTTVTGVLLQDPHSAKMMPSFSLVGSLFGKADRARPVRIECQVPLPTSRGLDFNGRQRRDGVGFCSLCGIHYKK